MVISVLAMAMAMQAAAMAAQSPAPTAQPVGTPGERDGRCLAAYAMLETQGEAEVKSGKIGATFFYGKLVGRDPAIDLVAALRTGAREAAGNLSGELLRCSGELQAASRAMLVAGDALRGPAAAPPR